MSHIVLPITAVLIFLKLAMCSHVNVCGKRMVTSLSQKNCTDKATNNAAFYLDKTECIPKCKLLDKSTKPGTCSSKETTTCSPGYSCHLKVCESVGLLAETSEIYSCETDSDCIIYEEQSKCGDYCILPNKGDDGSNGVSCMAYHLNYKEYEDNYWSAVKFKPTCDDNEKWAPKQCKGGLKGRCFCYSANGVRLFGQSLVSDSDDMTCACSRRKSELEESGRNLVSFHCDSKGNYEKIQCDIEKGLCWCAESLTGTPTTPFVPLVAIKKLFCYSEENVGSQYLRQCESKKYASAMISAKLKKRGVKLVASDDLLCDADGSYGAYRISSGIAYCSWRDNTNIGNWMANLNEMKTKLTCNCARDYKMYGWSLDCESTGNYAPLQITAVEKEQKYYCIDDDGFIKSPLLNDSTTNCTTYY